MRYTATLNSEYFESGIVYVYVSKNIVTITGNELKLKKAITGTNVVVATHSIIPGATGQTPFFPIIDYTNHSVYSSLATLNGSITPNPDVLVNSFDPTYSYIKKTGNVAILSLLTNGANITTVWQRLCTVSFKPQRNTMFIFYTLNTTISVGEGYIDTDGNVFVRALAEGTFNIRMSCAFAVQ